MSSYGKIKGKVMSKEYYENKILQSIWEFFPFVFRINDNYMPGATAFKILEAVCKERGWKEFGIADGKYSGANILGWNLWWRTQVMMHTQSRSLYSWQYTNHIPKAINFCNKEYLASYMKIMKNYFGEVYHFCPLTFTLPKEHELLVEEHAKRSEFTTLEEILDSNAKNLVPHIIEGSETDENGNDVDNNVQLKPVWICKPVGKSQGKGICLIDNLSNLPDHPITIVQEYIAKPLLISGYKFDLRLYVCIVSVSPLTIYAYREGLTRFATEPYNLADLDRSYSHLTNSSINKLGPGYELDKTGIGHGCKWTLRKLRQHLEREGETDWFMWQRIMSIIVLTILGEVGQQVGLSNVKNNFEFLGYDILIDANLRPWLLETNLSPGLGGDCDVDEKVKKPMLHQLFDLLGLPDSRPYLSLIPANSIQKSDTIIDVDEANNIALKITTGMEITSKSEATKPVQESSDNKDSSPPKTSSSDECEQTVVKIMDKSKLPPKASTKKQKISHSLQKRLLDVSAIYSQKLSQSDKKKLSEKESTKTPISPPISEEMSTEEAARLNFLASTDWIGSRDPNNTTGSTLPVRPGIGLKKRCWYDAPARQGDWIRIFPFDYLSFQMSRGHMAMDIKAIVSSMDIFLHTAEEIVAEEPGLSDDCYNRRVRENLSWNKVMWCPPR